MNLSDAAKLGLKDGDKVTLKNQLGELQGLVYIAPIQSGNLQVHWPEGNVLLDKSKRSLEGVPDYNAIVRLEKQT
jgi:anaerobic selenocysteine-containing dehydrogenase